MRKISWLVIVALAITVLLLKPAYADQFEIVVMVDITWSLHEEFADIEQYLLKSLLNDVLHDGDIFHLLWFSDTPQLLLKNEIITADNRPLIQQKLAGLVNLQWLFGKYTDLLQAVAYLIQYTKSLPQANKKVIILITDGIHDPPPGKTSSLTSEELKRSFFTQAEEIKRNGWSIHLLRTPSKSTGQNASDFFEIMQNKGAATITDLTSNQQASLLADLTGFAEVIFPSDLGEVGRQSLIPFRLKNNSLNAIDLRLEAILYNTSNLLTFPVSLRLEAKSEADLKASVLLPSELAPGPHKLPLKLVFNDEVRVLGTSGILCFTLNPQLKIPSLSSVPAWLFPWGLLVILAIALVLFLLFFFIRRLATASSFQRSLGIGSDHGRTKQLRFFHQDDRHSFAIEMIVTLQRRHIGHRNIRRLLKNRAASVGGKNSNFLIFLVKVPQKIATITWDGASFFFTPLKKEYFPENPDIIRDCLDKPIYALSKKGYRLELFFQRYVSPLEEINRIFEKLRQESKDQ